MNKIWVRKTKDGKHYFYDFWYEKKRYRKTTCLTKADTYKAAEARQKELEKGRLGILEAEPAKPILFEDFADQFLKEYSEVNKRPSSARGDKNSLGHLKPFFKNRYLNTIGPELVEKYKAERIKEVSPASVNRELACLKTIFNKAQEWGKIPVNPIAGKRVRKFTENNKKQRVLTQEETAGLMANAGGYLKPFLIIALNTGMRRNEILTLKGNDVDFLHAELTIRAEVSKSKKPRTIPMNRLVADAIREMPRGNRSGLVFFNPETGTNVKDIKTSFKTACRNAKIAGVRIHDLRHTAATRMIEAGVDIMTVKEILGHSSVEITMRYCHPSRETKARAMDKLGEAFKKALALDNVMDNPPRNSGALIPATQALVYN